MITAQARAIAPTPMRPCCRWRSTRRWCASGAWWPRRSRPSELWQHDRHEPHVVLAARRSPGRGDRRRRALLVAARASPATAGGRGARSVRHAGRPAERRRGAVRAGDQAPARRRLGAAARHRPPRRCRHRRAERAARLQGGADLAADRRLRAARRDDRRQPRPRPGGVAAVAGQSGTRALRRQRPGRGQGDRRRQREALCALRAVRRVGRCAARDGDLQEALSDAAEVVRRSSAFRAATSTTGWSR